MNTHFIRSLITIAALASTSAWAADFQGTPSAPSADCAARKAGGDKSFDAYLKIELKEVMVSSRSAPSTGAACDYAIKEQGVRAMRESPTRPTLDTSTKREASAPSVSERHTKTGHVTLLK